jgi:hypothetical protein
MEASDSFLCPSANKRSLRSRFQWRPCYEGGFKDRDLYVWCANASESTFAEKQWACEKAMPYCHQKYQTLGVDGTGPVHFVKPNQSNPSAQT